MPDPRSDRELLAAHVDGATGAFDELVRRYDERLWMLAFRTLDDREDAADVVQESLISAFRSAARYRGDSEVSTWLHRIVVNACLDRLRRRRARVTEPLVDHDLPVPRDGVDDHLTRITVERALASLPDSQRLAVVLVDVQGFSIAETAVLLGTREGTVKSRCARARTRLARLLGHLAPAGGNAPGPDGVQPSGTRGRQRSTPIGGPTNRTGGGT